ncbi:hypothetical protein CORC01_00294 [Colletotrichum orchidophilum]|uniref:Uncharacterized protein n=1 Tax=Colletotrichum orchidophilum TaxID=1209926 RepID=A0A1G4BSK8_9PEZI|nr:uncharacterized protein CORC01_00294 [Colletotrichum orchidophilum]OHF04442.1 hypothetical protein CORC01_00294 [Colletotrichum orchidophilum]
MSDSQPSYLVLGVPRLALICLAAKLYVQTQATGVQKYFESSYHFDTFNLFLSHFIKPTQSIWRQIPNTERRGLLEEYYPTAAALDIYSEQGYERDFTQLCSRWFRDTKLLMPEVLFMMSKQSAVALNQKNLTNNPASVDYMKKLVKPSVKHTATTKLIDTKPLMPTKRRRQEEQEVEVSVKKRAKLVTPGAKTFSTTALITTKDTSFEKKKLAVPVVKHPQTTTLTATKNTSSGKLKLAAPGSITSSTTVFTATKDTSAEKSILQQPKQRWLSDKEVGRIGRRPQGQGWRSKITPLPF